MMPKKEQKGKGRGKKSSQQNTIENRSRSVASTGSEDGLGRSKIPRLSAKGQLKLGGDKAINSP